MSILLVLPFIPAFVEWRFPQDSGVLELCHSETHTAVFSGQKILDIGMVFHSIQAECIRCGMCNITHPGFPLSTTLPSFTPDSARWYSGQHFWRSQGDIVIPPEVMVSGDLIADGNIILGARSVINGSVKSGGCLDVHNQARIEGGGIAEDITLHYAAAVSGVLVARRTIRLKTHSQVGSPTCSASVVATDIMLNPGACVYGAIHAHHQAWVVEMDEEYNQ
ncbi:hypothetical protein ACE6ZO_004097 [Salmonella enterica]|nr:hypothetical protein [Salmonella enterica]EDR1539085.1 hypothetical protein [Salmonella enterica subsp. enterica serovar Javiana]EGO3302074.1 hypothetical protein [Salmonella enterica]EHC5972839.1 hypothetical protein [Salmonella enterica]EIU9581237.1 hypothetical protein [Salmonella enterica]